MDIKDASFGGLISQPQQLQAWFDSEVPGTTGKLEVSMLRGGLSNVLFKVQRGSETFAIRRPPAISNDVSAPAATQSAPLMATQTAPPGLG